MRLSILAISDLKNKAYKSRLFAWNVLAWGALCAGLSCAEQQASGPHCEQEDIEEPAIRVDMSWDAGMPAGGGWLPDVTYNRAGTFLRKGDRLYFFEGVTEDSWQMLGRSFIYGGLWSAGTLASVYITLYGANSLGLMSTNGRLARALRLAGYGTSVAAIIYAWWWQLQNIYHRGRLSGYLYFGAHFMGGLESHQQGIQSYRRAQLSNTPPTPRLINIDFILVLSGLFGGWITDNFRALVSGKVINSVDIQLPACLIDQAFISIPVHDSTIGGATVRINRVPKALRNKKSEQYPVGCVSWRRLLKIMDRDHIDRLIIKPRHAYDETVLQVEFSDHRQGSSAKLCLTLRTGADDAPWVEQLLADGFSRREAESFRSVLQPEYIDQISRALNCYKRLPDGTSIIKCTGGTLHLSSLEDRSLDWVPDIQPQVDNWVFEKPGRTLFYFETPKSHTPYLSWLDAYGGPYLELSDGTAREISTMSQYHFSERVGYALTAELDYFVRMLPHFALGRIVIPGVQNLFDPGDPSEGPQSRNVPGLEDIERMSIRYAPSWLTNISSITSLLSD